MAKAIMVQGTMSNAGKSLITAGLCRIFHQDGYRVAPFKSQNMALNSYITRQGDEIGRAQVMQAEAAGVEPSVLMNPVLLKPVSDSGSQVIVNGKVVGQMPAAEYYRYKPQLIPKIQEAYNSLAAQHDIIVLEGAGSPAEINLKQQDIVNMGMAKMAKAPVLLVGDIDRGGVFASLYGTLALLTPEEQSRVKGLIINKFRGDVGLLRPGLSMLEDLVHKPVVGVVPYARLDLDEEDSLAETLERKAVPSLVEIAVIRLPHLSNFTDFSALNQIDGVGVRYISSAAELGEPDLIILPGTKNTIGDLLWLRSVGLEALVLRMAGRGVPVIGICGGYQMLGQRISDPHHTEMGGDVRGMGLLPCTTVFEQEKVRTRVTGKIQPLQGLFQELSGADFEGYEIHMGHTQSDAPAATAITTLAGEATTEGAALGNVLGTYVHGFFDSPQVAAVIAKLLFETKGVDASQITVRSTREWKESQYNLLADLLRENLDMQAVYRILEEGI